MKKFALISLIIITLLLSGCNNMMNTPTKKVEMFLAKYQTLDSDVLADLDRVIAEEVNFNSTQRDTYRNLMKKHYQNLTYDVKDEVVNGDKATVKVEIEVTDFSKAITKADTTLETNPEQFYNENNEYDIFKFNDYRLDLLKKVKERVKYTLELKLTKKDDKWELDDLTDSDYDKLNGIYIY